MSALILSRLQAVPILDALKQGRPSVATTLDLGLTSVDLDLQERGVVLPDGSIVPEECLKQIAKKENNCFAVDGGDCRPVHRFSPEFNRSYTLRATAGAPTMLISGFPMHRIKETTPDRDTEQKLAAAGLLTGRVLDTTTGLGYTAIGAMRRGARVTTVELDPAVLEIGRENPWSRELFDNPRIEQRVGSSFDIIREFAAGEFQTVMHDPPTFSLAGDLYSLEFYREAYRVLTSGGRMFHYIGDLESRSGRVVSKGVVRRLLEAGFKRVTRHPEAFALLAHR